MIKRSDKKHRRVFETSMLLKIENHWKNEEQSSRTWKRIYTLRIGLQSQLICQRFRFLEENKRHQQDRSRILDEINRYPQDCSYLGWLQGWMHGGLRMAYSRACIGGFAGSTRKRCRLGSFTGTRFWTT